MSTPPKISRSWSGRRSVARARREFWRHQRKDGTLLWVEVTTHPIVFRGRDVRLSMAVDVTEKKRLETELQAAYDREHRIAETLQRSFLITNTDTLYPGLMVEPLYRAAWDDALIGGDFYDTFALPGGRIALIVGDVIGKGLPAAARTAEIKYALRAYMFEEREPARMLDRLNAYMCEARQETGSLVGSFVALVAAVVDSQTGRLELAAAGAEHPYLLRANGEIEIVEIGGMPLGVDAGETYSALGTNFEFGDRLVLITDGIAEAGRGTGDAMREALSVPQTGTLRQMGRRILAAAQRLAGGALTDDACILLAQRVPLS